jgi:hypothetical protein
MKRPVVLLLAGLLVSACSQSYGGGAETRPDPTPLPPPALDPVGAFDFQTEAMGSAVTGTFTITGTPGAYTGSMTTDMGGFAMSDIAVDGMKLSFVGESPDVVVLFLLVFDGDSFSGGWDAEGMSGSVTGSRR